MPRAEALAAFEAEAVVVAVAEERPRLLVFETSADEGRVVATLERLALAHDASVELFSCPWQPDDVSDRARGARFPRGVGFAVRAERLGESGPRRMTVEREIGAALADVGRVDLIDPQVIVRAFIDGEYVWVGRRIWDRDPKETAARHVKHRPVGSPVSLPPKLARSLVNLSRVPRGKVLYDPFCGTGGVLLEAAAMGIAVVGSDLDPEMVAATKTNLAHYKLPEAGLFSSDVGRASEELGRRRIVPDVVVCDLPYGRSASTGKEALAKLYDRSFEAIRSVLRPDGRAVVGLPSESAAKRAADYLEVIDLFKVWVHRSLTRHFVVLRRP
jgi:tRNA (guanine10-N2)-dimethyltransferase